MQILLIFFLCALATSKVTVQSLFGKRNVKTATDALFFNGLVFAFSAVIFLPGIGDLTPRTTFFGAIFGLLSVLFQLTYLKALSTGAVSLTGMIVNLSMVFSIGVSVIVYHEPLTPFRIAGILLTIVSFLVCTDFKPKEKLSSKWFLLASLASLANGGIGVNQKIFSSAMDSSSMSYVSCGYLFACGISAVFFLVCRLRGEKITFALDYRPFLFAFLTGGILGFFQFLNTYAVSVIDGTLLFPAYSGGGIIMATLSGVLLFRDKLSGKQKISLLVGFVAILLMTL